MNQPSNLLNEPIFAEALADELAFAGLPPLDELGATTRDAISKIELSVRAVLHQSLNPRRTQDERRAVVAALMACATYAATRFGPGDLVTVAWWWPAEPDRPEGRVLAVDGQTVTVRWDYGRIERIDATELRHDHPSSEEPGRELPNNASLTPSP